MNNEENNMIGSNPNEVNNLQNNTVEPLNNQMPQQPQDFNAATEPQSPLDTQVPQNTNTIVEPQPVQSPLDAQAPQSSNVIMEPQPAVQQPQYGQMPQQPMYQQPTVEKKSNKTIIIIAVVAVLVIVGVVVAILLSKKPASTNKGSQNKNEYEDVGGNGGEDVDGGETPVTTNTIEYEGFTFEKVPGYSYEVKDQTLIVADDQYGITIETKEFDYNEFKSAYESKAQNWEDSGYIVNETKISNISSREFIIYNVTYQTNTFIIYITKSPSADHIFIGSIFDGVSGSASESDLSKVATILSKVKYTGGYSGYSKDIKIDSSAVDFSKRG